MKIPMRNVNSELVFLDKHEILEEINRDRAMGWIPYTVADWADGLQFTELRFSFADLKKECDSGACIMKPFIGRKEESFACMRDDGTVFYTPCYHEQYLTWHPESIEDEEFNIVIELPTIGLFLARSCHHDFA